MEEKNQYNKNCFLIKIKSKYIIKKIFQNLSESKKIKTILYNKNMQSRLNIENINEYLDDYSKIEIEIIPEEKKYCKFINIPKRNDSYYHIYFNDSTKEKKKNYIDNDKIKKIKIVIDYKIKSLTGLFLNRYCIKKINFIKFNRTNIKNMSNMFNGCSALEEINLSNFNTTKVKNMSKMFDGCFSLKELNCSKFNTSNVINMSNMFYNCKSLIKLNLSNFNTNNVKNMSNMFYGCLSLKELNLSKFNANNVNDIEFMFEGCSSLKELVCSDGTIMSKYYDLIMHKI